MPYFQFLHVRNGFEQLIERPIPPGHPFEPSDDVLRKARTHRLGRNDRIYRGSDNRYYCRRDDGTAGLIIGGIGGGVLGNIIAPGGSKTLGTIIGAGAGALIGKAIDEGNVVCR